MNNDVKTALKVFGVTTFILITWVVGYLVNVFMCALLAMS